MRGASIKGQSVKKGKKTKLFKNEAVNVKG
jgi:hypothetical protein